MSVDYTKLFTRTGKFVKYSDARSALASSTMPPEIADVETTFGTALETFQTGQFPLEGFDLAYQGFQDSVTGIRQSLVPFASATLTDVDNVISQIPGLTAGADINTVLAAIQQDMQDNGQSVNKSVSAASSITALASNNGNGVVIVDLTLDGSTPPGSGFPSSPTYNGRSSELVVPSEIMQLACIADSFTDRVAEGSEVFSWSGGSSYAPFDWHNEGSGQGPSVTVANGNNIVGNQDFEQWNASVPSRYTILSGAGNISQNTVAGNVFRGVSSLQFSGNAAMTQSLSGGALAPLTRYLLTIRLKQDGTASSGSINLGFTGPGYTSPTINVAASMLTTSYALYTVAFNTPITVPSSGLALNISAAGGLNGKVYMDSLSFGQPTYSGGVGVSVIAGSAPFTRGDRMRFTVSNTEGLFQRFFRRAYGIQLPSVLNGSPSFALLLTFTLFTASMSSTIPDSLAA